MPTAYPARPLPRRRPRGYIGLLAPQARPSFGEWAAEKGRRNREGPAWTPIATYFSHDWTPALIVGWTPRPAKAAGTPAPWPACPVAQRIDSSTGNSGSRGTRADLPRGRPVCPTGCVFSSLLRSYLAAVIYTFPSRIERRYQSKVKRIPSSKEYFGQWPRSRTAAAISACESRTSPARAGP